jgi:hypothetical protein
MKKTERKLFSNKKDFDQLLNYYIDQKKPFDFLELLTKKYYNRNLYLGDIDICLDRYNIFKKYKINSEQSKKMAMRYTYEYMKYSKLKKVIEGLR